MEQKLEIKIGNSQAVAESLAARTVEAIKRKKPRERCSLVCSKGSSIKDYYSAFKQLFSIINPNEMADVRAFSIDEDFGTTNGLDFLKENMPKYVRVYGINARFHHDGRVVDSENLKKLIEENPKDYLKDGRTIIPLSSNKLIGDVKIVGSNYAIDDGGIMRLSGKISFALIGLGVNPLHIGSNFPPTNPEEEIHLAEKVDANGNVVGYAMTLGIKKLYSAEEVILFAAGKSKAEGVKRALEGLMNEDCPPSYLRKAKNLVFALDYDSSSLLDKKLINELYKDREVIWS